MNEEFKWYTIAIVIIFSVLFGSIAYTAHAESECLQSYAHSNRSAAEIKHICRD